MLRLISTSVLILSFFSQVFAQAFNGDIFVARKKREQGLYLDAAVHYEDYVKKNPDNKDVNTEYAEMLFFEQKDYEHAYPYMKKVLTYEKDSISYYHALARIEHYFGNFDLAASMYKQLLNIYVSEETMPIINDSKLGLQQIDYYKTHKDKVGSQYLHVVNLGTHINSPYPEYVPVVDEREDFVMFTSRRKNVYNKFPDVDDDMFHEDMYMARRKGKEFDTALALPADYVGITEVENSKAHESIVSLSPDGKILFIYKLGTLWRSDHKNGKWSEPVQIDRQMISKDYVNHVSITEDGKTIYYTSEKKNSKGNLDIYKATMKSDGTWTEAESVGDAINSKGSEQSPYISADGKTLFFSSNGLGGFGGYDIFKSVWNGKEWGKPENLGMPYNSISDDVFFYPKKDLTEGFFSSNRKGGVGSFDIYRYYFADKPSFDTPDLVVVDKKEDLKPSTTQSTMQWIKEQAANPTTEKMFFRINGETVTDDASKVEKMIADGKVKKLEIEQVEKCATCAYKTSSFYTANDPTTDAMLAANNALLASTNTNTTNNANTSGNVVNNTTSNTTNTSTSGNKFEIYFEFDSDQLTPESMQKLDEVAARMSSDPKYKASITGRTDFMGVDIYNDWLSLKRARAAASYLKGKGVEEKRMTKVEGGGALQPLGACKGMPCVDQNAKARRVEIVLTP